MRSGYELDVYFNSKRFRRRLDFFRELGEGYDFVGALFIVNQFELMQYHYGVIRHYILTGEYDPSKENRHQIEVIDYTNRRLAGLKSHSPDTLEELGLQTPLEGVHLLLPPGIRKKDIIAFIEDPRNSKTIKTMLDEAYGEEPGQKHSFRPVERIDTYLEIVDLIDEARRITLELTREFSLDYSVDEADIRKLYKRLGSQNNPYLNPIP